jgi:NADPH:quinone reductase-like Zn-dependent oxidoreductase
VKAVRIAEYGKPPTLIAVPAPTIGPDEVLVRVKASAINHLDLVEASGMAKEFFPIALPWTPGHELSGIVEQIGSKVENVAVGDAVFGDAAAGGAFAELAAVKANVIVKKPANLSHEEAASVPVAAQTAWQGIFTHGHLARGQTILIHGGAGAVGAYAVQLAAQAGATVVATASGDDEAYLTSLGASHVIDYRKARFELELRDKVDVVLDLIGGETQQRSFLVLKKGGFLVAANQPVPQDQAAQYGITGVLMSLAPSAADLSAIARLLETGKLHADVATVYPLEEVAKAWDDMAGGPAAATRRRHGKIVLRVS